MIKPSPSSNTHYSCICVHSFLLMTKLYPCFSIHSWAPLLYKGVSKSFWTGCLEWELKMVQLSATRCSCIAVLWVSLASFSAVTLCVVSRVFIVVVCLVMDSVRNFWIHPRTNEHIYKSVWKWQSWDSCTVMLRSGACLQQWNLMKLYSQGMLQERWTLLLGPRRICHS